MIFTLQQLSRFYVWRYSVMQTEEKNITEVVLFFGRRSCCRYNDISMRNYIDKKFFSQFYTYQSSN